MKRRLVVFLALFLLAPGCGGEGDDEETGDGLVCGEGTVEENGACVLAVVPELRRCEEECWRIVGIHCGGDDNAQCAADCRLRIEGYPLTSQNCILDTITHLGNCNWMIGEAREGRCQAYCSGP